MTRSGMHAADPDRSKRLQRVLGVLADGLEHSTLDLMRQAQVCAVNSCIAELRVAGHSISCRIGRGEAGGRVWFYRLQRRSAPEQLSLAVAA